MIVNELSENISIAFKAILWMFLKIKDLFGKLWFSPNMAPYFSLATESPIYDDSVMDDRFNFTSYIYT
jgi:hypothetical protein